MEIKIESGANVQITDKQIVNNIVYGDVVQKKEYVIQNRTEEAEKDSENTVQSQETAPQNTQPTPSVSDNDDGLNYETPRIVLQKMLLEEWFSKVCVNSKLYTTRWRKELVDNLMASEHGKYIASQWEHKDKIQTIKGKFIGTLILAGVLDTNKLSVARDILGISPNTRNEDEKKEASTLANYMGQGKKEPYLDWIKDYVERTTSK